MIFNLVSEHPTSLSCFNDIHSRNIKCIMSLSVDANKFYILPPTLAKDSINLSVLKQIEDDLDIDEKLSILFLMITDYTSPFHEIFKLFEKARSRNEYIITEFVQNHPENWQDKFLEAIYIINNRAVIKKLGISFKDLDLMYVSDLRTYSKNLPPIAKCLYMLCESLSEEETELLLKQIKNDLKTYEDNLNDISYLELHMLYWMDIKFISILPARKDIQNLLKHLKRFDNGLCQTICIDLEKCESHLNISDSSGVGVQSQTVQRQEEPTVKTYLSTSNLKEIKTGMCIIINEMYFRLKYETRYGTNADRDRLRQTFKNFGFKVHVFENLKRTEVIEKMRNISNDFGTDYDCIFLCILSHGYKGGVITSDEEKLALEEIEQEICCMELKDIIKVVIIQACQGKNTGQASGELTTDGLTSQESVCDNLDIRPYRNFCIFMSTIQRFVALRHKEEGSWFIQEFCNILQNEGNNITFNQAVRKVMESVYKKRGAIEGNDSIAQLPELRQDRLLTDFTLPKVALL